MTQFRELQNRKRIILWYYRLVEQAKERNRERAKSAKIWKYVKEKNKSEEKNNSKRKNREESKKQIEQEDRRIEMTQSKIIIPVGDFRFNVEAKRLHFP